MAQSDIARKPAVDLSRKIPRGLGVGGAKAPLATSFWFPPDSLEAQVGAGSGLTWRSDRLWLGRTTGPDNLPVGWNDDRHVCTIAGSRAGKNVSAILPVLCDYPGSVICIDPKGENAFHTADRRGKGRDHPRIDPMHQDVFVLDPYGVADVDAGYSASFDPLSGLDEDPERAPEEAALIADAMVIGTDAKDAHWDESARALIEAIILHVLSWPDYAGDRTLGRVRRLLRDGDREELARFHAYIAESSGKDPEAVAAASQETAFSALLEIMAENEAYDGVIAGTAAGLRDLGDRERGSILSTARRNTKFLDAPRMQACLRASGHTLRLEDLKRGARRVTVYLVLPSRLMRTHARWMRLLLNLTIARMERDGAPPEGGLPVLAILDEANALGHMPILESAIGYMAGFGLKLWSIWQDLSQLKRHYEKSWETFLGNAGTLQAFGNVDATTLDYLSKRLGEIEVIRETESRNSSSTETTTEPSEFERIRRSEQGGTFRKLLGDLDMTADTAGRSVADARSETTAQTIQKTALMGPDEVRRVFARSSGLQIISIADYRPMILQRCRYFEDPQFAWKFRPRPGP